MLEILRYLPLPTTLADLIREPSLPRLRGTMGTRVEPGHGVGKSR